MNRTTWLQERRMQKFRDVLSRWKSGELPINTATLAKTQVNLKLIPGVDGRLPPVC
jgi:hypothetical protein